MLTWLDLSDRADRDIHGWSGQPTLIIINAQTKVSEAKLPLKLGNAIISVIYSTNQAQ